MMLRILKLRIAIVIALLMLAACAEEDDGAGTTAAEGSDSTAASGDTQQLSIATGGTGGVYFPLGGGMAQVIRGNIEGYDATVQETNASVDNMQLLATGGADLALALADTTADAVAGTGEFTEPLDICALGRIYNNFTQLVTSADSGIVSVADLAGTTVSLGAPGSGTEVIALRILEAAGIDPDADISRQQLGVDETVAALRDGNIDAGFWSGGLPTGALVDYATTGDMVIVPTAEYTQDLGDAYGAFYVEDPIPAGTYQGQDEEIPTIVVPNLLVVSTGIDEALQEDIVRAIFEHKDDLVAVHAAAQELDPAIAQQVDFMDICPGAAAYYESL